MDNREKMRFFFLRDKCHVTSVLNKVAEMTDEIEVRKIRCSPYPISDYILSGLFRRFEEDVWLNGGRIHNLMTM